LLADVAGSATVDGWAVLDAADATLSLMEHPR
jgi:3-hydroxyisobutyrate dehydrogenase